ncbi:hypothetical protein [Planococcus halotolerans]|uniref:Uncharacterized protein n=1 Tax=Planococcus halotolerans TaxID=2233542 RepID=A0A365KUC9_9BACL|nr:hypothetical protein [Planococcus halotolerans]RAZ76773.1 hypothetical protein DP120_12140 [Planococcus halotolerans]
MNLSKNKDPLFIELGKIERSEQMKSATFQKLQTRIQKKRSIPVMPAVISVALATVTFFLVFSFMNESPETAGSLTDAEAIEKVLNMQLNKPEDEFFEVVYAKWQRMEEVYASETEYTSDPMEGTPELIAYEEYIEKNFKPYFTTNGFDNFKVQPMDFHYFFAMDNQRNYEMELLDLNIEQSENTATNYSFTAEVEYTDPDGESNVYNLTGRAIVPEQGKIGQINFTDANEFQQKISDDATP